MSKNNTNRLERTIIIYPFFKLINAKNEEPVNDAEFNKLIQKHNNDPTYDILDDIRYNVDYYESEKTEDIFNLNKQWPLLQKIMEENKDKYDYITLKWAELEEGLKEGFYIAGIRKETDQEYNDRIKSEIKAQEQRKIAKENRKKEKEQKRIANEKKLLKELQNKYKGYKGQGMGNWSS